MHVCVCMCVLPARAGAVQVAHSPEGRFRARVLGSTRYIHIQYTYIHTYIYICMCVCVLPARAGAIQVAHSPEGRFRLGC